MKQYLKAEILKVPILKVQISLRTKFNGTSLIGASFKNSLLVESDFTAANILNANFEGANLNNAIWTDGTKCGLESIGLCKKK